LNVNSVITKKSLTLRQRALKLAKTDFWTAFHMVHNPDMVQSSVGIVSIKVNDKDKNEEEK
jgi:hypothetical protein